MGWDGWVFISSSSGIGEFDRSSLMDRLLLDGMARRLASVIYVSRFLERTISHWCWHVYTTPEQLILPLGKSRSIENAGIQHTEVTSVSPAQGRFRHTDVSDTTASSTDFGHELRMEREELCIHRLLLR